MKNKWIKIMLASAIVIVLEILCVLLYLRPYILRQSVYTNIEKGLYSRTDKSYNKLDDKSKRVVDDNFDAYIKWLCKCYFDGDKTYDEVTDSLDIIKAYVGDSEVYREYANYINSNELVKTITRLQRAELAWDSDAIYKGQNTINKLVLRMDNKTREEIMISLLCDKYKKYLKGKLTAEGMKTYAFLVKEMSYYSAYDLAQRIYNNIDCVEWYRLAYEKADELSVNKNYVGALELISKIEIDKSDKVYKKKFKRLYDNTYALGKLYYEDLFEKYESYKDNESALALLAELSNVYGDAFDMNGLQSQVASGWQNAYIALVEDYDKILKRDIEGTENGQYIIDNAMDSVWPDSMCMYDVDDDGTPEAFLFNSERINDDYVECFMYNYNGKKAEYMGYVNVISFCVNSNLLTFPRSFGRDTGEEYELTAYDGSMIGTMTYCQNIDGEYYVDGENVSDYEFLSAKSNILQYQGRYKVSNIGHSSLDEAKSYILTYK